jgi:hypothetical protein
MSARAPVVALCVCALAACQEDTVVAPTLSVTCSATPASGTAPLNVNFVVNVAGAQGAATFRIDYGDGSTGSDVAAPHAYAAAGSYSATFTVSTATQSAVCTAPVRVAAPPEPSPTPTPPAGNREPEIHFRTTPEPSVGRNFTASSDLTIEFNMCTSSDPDGDDLNFRMDLDGDGAFEVDGPTGADCRRRRTYSQTGLVSPTSYDPVLCATDLLPSRARAHPYSCRTYNVKIYRFP